MGAAAAAPQQQAAHDWVWRTRHVARRKLRTDSPPPTPCSFGLLPAQLRRHAAHLLALGLSRDEVLARLDIPPHAVPDVPARRRPG